jgi:alkylation response protein AidB-like acyl-CoA dehydrogenase
MPYSPPVQDIIFTLSALGFDRLPEHPDFGKIDEEVLSSILEPAAKLAADVLAPLNHSGDKVGAMWKEGAVKTAPGFKEAYKQYCEGGWNAVPFAQDYGGQGLPWTVAFAVQEMWQGANMSFGLCPLLNQGAVEAIHAHGSEAQKDQYLPKLISGEWTGTMNLTEPQAGSDLAAVRTRAERAADGTFRIFGQKIYITYGEHDFTENIIHLVLARLPDAPEGVKGISLFIVPKFLADGIRNDVFCTGIEHKLGIHASPTCTMQFGDHGGATGYLIGQENEGLKYMFTMMNNARLSVGLQGVAIAEAAYQKALDYARERVQGAPLSKKDGKVAIAAHADVKRMLLSMASQIEAGRAMAFEAALAMDLGEKEKVEILTPLVKAWCTDMAVEVASLGVQVHGGMGFVEETGAAQFYRDARILPIYEGTNGIQAMDFVFRKVLRDGGAGFKNFLKEMEAIVTTVKTANGDDFEAIYNGLDMARQGVLKAADYVLALAKENADDAAAVATPFLKAAAIYAGAALLAKKAYFAQEILSQGSSDHDFLERKIIHARFFAENILPMAEAHVKSVLVSAKTVTAASF